MYYQFCLDSPLQYSTLPSKAKSAKQLLTPPVQSYFSTFLVHQRCVDTKKWYYTVYCTGVLAYTDGKKSVKIEIAKNVFFTGWSESHLYHIIEISTIYDFHCIPITNIF